MKKIVLEKAAETIKTLMEQQNITVSELAKKTEISYPSLLQVLKGARDCGFSKLIAIANALNTTPNTLLAGLFNAKNTISRNHIKQNQQKIEYLVVFISIISATHCLIYDIKSQTEETSILPFSLRCGQDVDEFFGHILSQLSKSQNLKGNNISNKNIAVFVSVQQYGRITSRKKIQQNGESLFGRFLIESDATTNHFALFGTRNGICITINNGDAITYNNGSSLVKLQGYGFPISDVAGNYWIGNEAVKHVINVKENIEQSSLLSDKILALFENNLDFLSECIIMSPEVYYPKISSIVKELLQQGQKPYEIVQKSVNLLMHKVAVIDQKTKKPLPIALAGDLAHIYEDFFPKERILKTKNKQSYIILNYGLNLLRKDISNLKIK